MQAKREHRRYENGAKVWVGRYRNSHNKPHWHYDCELLYVECGKLELTVNRESFCATAGQAVFIAGGQTHQMQALMPDTELSMIIFDGDIVKEFAGECTLSHPLLTGDYGISETAGEIEADLKNRALFFQCETASKIQMLMIKIFRGEEIAEPRKVSPPRTVRLKNLLAEIDEKYQYYDLTAAADFMGMNTAYFSRLFHKLAGMTFSQYLNRVRVEKAVDILKENDEISMTEVSLRCGFDSIRNFNRIFKKYTGYTPSAMPREFVFENTLDGFNDNSRDPTMAECVLLDSSDMRR